MDVHKKYWKEDKLQKRKTFIPSIERAAHPQQHLIYGPTAPNALYTEFGPSSASWDKCERDSLRAQ